MTDINYVRITWREETALLVLAIKRDLVGTEESLDHHVTILLEKSRMFLAKHILILSLSLPKQVDILLCLYSSHVYIFMPALTISPTRTLIARLLPAPLQCPSAICL